MKTMYRCKGRDFDSLYELNKFIKDENYSIHQILEHKILGINWVYYNVNRIIPKDENGKYIFTDEQLVDIKIHLRSALLHKYPIHKHQGYNVWTDGLNEYVEENFPKVWDENPNNNAYDISSFKG